MRLLPSMHRLTISRYRGSKILRLIFSVGSSGAMTKIGRSVPSSDEPPEQHACNSRSRDALSWGKACLSTFCRTTVTGRFLPVCSTRRHNGHLQTQSSSSITRKAQFCTGIASLESFRLGCVNGHDHAVYHQATGAARDKPHGVNFSCTVYWGTGDAVSRTKQMNRTCWSDPLL